MTKIDWDIPEIKGATDGPNPPFANSTNPIEEKAQVKAIYKGKIVILRIKKKVKDDEFLTEVTGFSPPAAGFRGLMFGDEVMIDRKHISSLLK